MSTPIETASNPFNDFVFVNAIPADRGSFTLALDKALDKLEKFQLPDPSYFILQWVQALVAAGSTTITIRSESGFTGQYSLTLEFDGPGYTAKELQSLYDHVFLSGRDRTVDRLRELALGWLSASSLTPTRMAVRCNGWERLRDKTETAGKDVTRQCELGDGASHKIEIAGRGYHALDKLITDCCTDVPVPLILNNTQISHPANPTGVPWPNRPFKNGTTHGVMGATYGHDSKSQIAFLRYGVNFVSRTESGLVPPVIIRASDPTLSKNVSQTDVVKDDAYEEFLARLRSEMKSMGLALTGKRIPSYQRDSLNRYLQAYIASNLDIRALMDSGRLEKLGADYQSLLNFPVFCSNKGIYRSLTDLHATYKQQGCLLYCLESQARAVPWAGVLLVLEVEEVAVLRKFFPNLVGLSLDDVRQQSRSGRASSPNSSTDAPTLAGLQLVAASRRYLVTVPDSYPTGQAVIQAANSKFGTVLSQLPLSLRITFLDKDPPDHTEVIALQQKLRTSLTELKRELQSYMEGQESERTFSRSRAAELICEILNFEISHTTAETRWSDHPCKEFSDAPLIGLEDGRLVSLNDLKVYLEQIPIVYVGGAFLDGLESGALDPMPEAAKLLARLYPAHALVPIERIRARLADDPGLRFELRRQTVMKGLAARTSPKLAIQRFANEAAAEEAELQRIEREYRKALEQPVLFVKPDDQRLADLAAEDDGEALLLDLTTAPAQLEGSERGRQKPDPSSKSDTLPAMPSLESDLELCRGIDPDLLPPGLSVQIERREPHFCMHLAVGPIDAGKLIFLQASQRSQLALPIPLRGFLRLDPNSSLTYEQLLAEGVEQLTIKAAHAFLEGPTHVRLRRTLRDWLLAMSCHNTARLRESASASHDLFDMPVLPCLGQKYLSWRTLLDQAQRCGETVFSDKPDLRPCPNREVLLLTSPVTPEILASLGFPNLRRFEPETTGDPFETLYRSTRRDLSSVLSGHSTPLLQSGLIEPLAGDASLWKRWRSGFLSWDKDGSVAVMNPNHRIGKKLAERFATDPSWSRIFASALYSTINRGLEEVEDHHERAFLEGLIETLD